MVGRVGAGVQAEGATSDAFVYGLGGVAIAWLAALAVSMAIETFVGVLHIGPVAFLLPIPFVLGYALGFGVGFAMNRQPVVTPTQIGPGLDADGQGAPGSSEEPSSGA
jgi:hypothetical protein